MLFSVVKILVSGLLLKLLQGWPGSFFADANVVQSNSCCSALQDALKHKVAYPSDNGYSDSLSSYWSTQEQEVHPSCIVSPSNVQDVAKAISILTKSRVYNAQKCRFAIKGGGHTPFAGGANIEAGVTLDLGQLNHTVLAKDRESVSVGPGARWVDVYNTLIPHGLSTSGGRVAGVGVGGLTLGGGVSFFSPRFGFVCDNVENFQVVTSSGKIIDANAKENSDLWKALRGGSNNFGVVTAFRMRTFKQGDFWGGFTVHPISTRRRQFQLFENFTKSKHYDRYSSLINSYTYNTGTGIWFISNNLEYTKSNPAEPNPPVFQPFTSLEQTANTMRVTNLSDLTIELNAVNPSGIRDLFVTSTFSNSASMMNKFFELANNTVHRLTEVKGLQFSVSFQPFSKAITLKGAKNGGNSLGITAQDGDMFNMLASVKWNSTKHDAVINQEIKKLFREAEAAAKGMRTYRKYLYLNYAAKWQDPFEGYGKEMLEQLRMVAKKYDPEQVFQKQVPGGFKLHS